MTTNDATASNDNGLAAALRRAAEEVVDAPETKRLLDAYDAAPPTTPPWVVEVRNDGHEDRAWTLNAPEAAAVNNYRRLLASNRALHTLLSHAEGGRLLAAQKYEDAHVAWLGTREEMNELLDAERARADKAEAALAAAVAAGREACADLLALASQAEADAARYVADAREADRADAEASAERLRVRGRAYRHAAEMLREVAA